MTDPRIAVLAAISSPDWHPVPEAHGMPWDEAEQLLAAYDASRAAAPSAHADADLPAPGESYRHYKGGLYTVDALAEDTGIGVQTVVYHDEQQHHWVRPLSEFTGTVAGVQRFTLEGVLAGRERNPADADLRNRVARALAEVTVGHRAFITVDVQAEYPRADAVLAALPAPADRALTAAEGDMLGYALSLVEQRAFSRSGKLDDNDRAVIARLRRRADEAQQAGPCEQHPNAPTFDGKCGGCTQYPTDMVKAQPAEVVHGCPPDDSGLTPCCGRSPFELPLTDRISSEAPTTCPGAAGTQQGGQP